MGPECQTHPVSPSESFAVVLLAGGTGQRLGGVDKATLGHPGAHLLTLALVASREATAVVVVGPEHPDHPPHPPGAGHPGLRYVREEPVGSGPAAALGAGIRALPHGTESVVGLAVDMPRVRPATLRRLAGALADHSHADGAVLVDPHGRHQLAFALRRSVAAPLGDRDLAHLGVWRALGDLVWVEVPAVSNEHHDIDTPTDLHEWLTAPPE